MRETRPQPIVPCLILDLGMAIAYRLRMIRATQTTEVHMMIIRNGTGLVIGQDLVDCVTGTMQSHGTVTVKGTKETTIKWTSTVGAVHAEQVIRASVKQDYKRVTHFMSQAIA
jgi:pyrimidine deaminase RibD-like protein